MDVRKSPPAESKSAEGDRTVHEDQFELFEKKMNSEPRVSTSPVLSLCLLLAHRCRPPSVSSRPFVVVSSFRLVARLGVVRRGMTGG
jgi:hypothetical protein